MNDYDPTSPHDTLLTRPASSATSGPSVDGRSGDAGAAPPPPAESSPDWSAPVTMAKQARWPRVRRLLSNRRSRWIVAAAVLCGVIGLSVGLATSHSARATSSPATAGHLVPTGGSAAGPGSGGGASNARSGPAAGGASGTIGSVSTSSLTLSTSAGQKVTVDEESSTTYQNGTSSTSASAITTGEPVLVLGTISGTTITATQVIVQPTGDGSSTSSAATVIPFQRGAPTTSKQVGQIPASFSQGSGTIVSGTAANKATEAALAAYPGGIVDRVVKLSNGEYNVHYIGVNWPHHVFVNQDFKVVGAE
jgi:hypothetical protein